MTFVGTSLILRLHVNMKSAGAPSISGGSREERKRKGCGGGIAFRPVDPTNIDGNGNPAFSGLFFFRM